MSTYVYSSTLERLDECTYCNLLGMCQRIDHDVVQSLKTYSNEIMKAISG